MSLRVCTSQSRVASRGACLESTDLGSGGQRWVREWRSTDWGGGEGHRALGQVGVGSGVNW